ncbi:hypothetical protein BBD42_23315 [Paenibacillus sp. BIHB 4019]|uniref:SLH domain-containing protein n=1 Tax=Paenibacillus sp. BIHB 4019 TaxID=1870819 RepID=A0A1B2DN05_9BACL|nr:Ig-like domain-containing protein [Paenibacillus sp. BIHB 4019]ANY69083.1 hypothetical protein BBD42_23315 [Paenibacillus sp. BIHB 4019]
MRLMRRKAKRLLLCLIALLLVWSVPAAWSVNRVEAAGEAPSKVPLAISETFNTAKEMKLTGKLSGLGIDGMPVTYSLSAGDGPLVKASGTIFSAGPPYRPGFEAEKVFDGDVSTYYDFHHPSGAYVGIDLGEGNEAVVRKLRFHPRDKYPSRMVDGQFQGSNEGTNTGYLEDFYVVPPMTKDGWREEEINDPTAYRYLRYAAPFGGWGNIAEIEFYLDMKPPKGTVTLLDPADGIFEYIPAPGYVGIDQFAFKVNDGSSDSEFGIVTINVQDGEPSSNGGAHWRFEQPADGSFQVKDLSGNGNDLYRVDVMKRDVPDIFMDWSDEKPAFSKSTGSLQISSYDSFPDELSYLRTADDAPLNAMTFSEGYTFETYIRLASSFDAEKNGWMGLLGRGGTGRDGGKMDGDRNRPLAALSVSTNKEMKWAAYPTNLNDLKTNWSGEMLHDWIHVAVVNDSLSTIMYINGSPVLRNDEGAAGNSVGLATAQKNGSYVPWIIGASQYNNLFEKGFNGWINEIRITDRALAPSEFLINENEAPVSSDLSVTTDQNKAYTGQLSAIDPDLNTLTYEIKTQPANGTLNANAQGSFVYTPNPNYNGLDYFTYRAYDGKAYSNEAQVKITIIPNHAPVAVKQEHAVRSGEVLKNILQASDADGDALSFRIVKQPSKGSATITDAATGAFEYVPAVNATGIDFFAFQASDGKNESEEALVIIQINDKQPETENWEASNLEFTLREGGKLTGRLADAVTETTENMSVQVLKAPAKGQLTVTDSVYGVFEYTADAGATGQDSFVFQIGAGGRLTNEAYGLIRILPNGKPQATALTISTQQNTAITGHLKATDAEGDMLHYVIATEPTQGTVTLMDHNTGSFMYTPRAGFIGSDSFTYTAGDGIAVSDSAKVSILVAAPPVSGGGSSGGGGVSPLPTPTPAPVLEPTPSPAPTNGPEQPAGLAPFTDMQKHWAKPAIERLYAMNALNGYPDGSFHPQGEMTRAEFAILIVKVLGIKADEGPSFDDMNSHWAEDAVRAAAKLGLVEGMNTRTFGPNEKITREQMAVILARVFQLNTDSTKNASFSDNADISPWALGSLNALVELRAIQGYKDGYFRPLQAVSRAEAAEVIVRLLDIQAAKQK